MFRIISVITAAVAAGILAVAGFLFVSSSPPHSRPAASPAIHAPSAAKAARARAALIRLLHNSTPTVLLVGHSGKPTEANVPAPSNIVKNQEASFNWAGYVSTSTTAQEYTHVVGTWKVPKSYCNAEQRLTSDWVGLDGWTTSTVEQDGTLNWCFEGTAYYYSWYEMYPAGTVEVGSSVEPGDAIKASVTRSGTNYTLALTDSTNTANSFSVAQTCALTTCLDESAEWIMERPAYSIGITPLADTGTLTFGGGQCTAGGTVYNIATSPGETSVVSVDATDTYPLTSVGTLSGGTGAIKWLNSY
jgi:Peptidase A4 family